MPKSWSNTRGTTVSGQKERLNKQMWFSFTGQIAGNWIKLLISSSRYCYKIREIDSSRILRDPNLLLFNYLPLLGSPLGISNILLILINWDASVFAWYVAISSSISILLFCRFWTFAAWALIYGSRKHLYFDHKFKQHFL